MKDNNLYDAPRCKEIAVSLEVMFAASRRVRPAEFEDGGDLDDIFES